MRIIGIDLAVTAKHRAIVLDERSRFISPIITFHTELAALDRLRGKALEGAAPDCELVVVMEATNIVWYPISVYFLQRGATVHVVNPRISADLGRFYKRHAQSDRLAAKTLARLPLVSPEILYPLMLSGGDYLALQRGCRELDRLTSQASAIKNRLQDTDLLAWPGLKQRVFSKGSHPVLPWFRDHFYDPRRVVEAGEAGVRQAWRARRRLAQLEADATSLRVNVTRPLYRQLHPSRNLETIKGVGQAGAAVFVGFIGAPLRFASNRRFRGWSGMVPRSAQSGEAESRGLRITRAGPNLIKKYSYLDADSGRKRDPQLAAIYYDQMVNHGKHHTQAVCACATHLLDRVRIVLTEDRPYELRDVDGTPVTDEQALAIIAERYTVPDDVRRRTNKGARRERAQRQAERKEKAKRSRSR